MHRSTSSTFTCALVVLSFLLTAGSIQGQTMSFLRQFTTAGMDRATAVASDGSGIYVIGNRPAEQGVQASAGVSKYDSGGNEQWTREFSFPALGSVTLFAAAADATGVYVLGFGGPVAGMLPETAGRCVLRKYSPSGGEVWTRELGFFPPGDLAVDATGVYVAGRDFPPNTSYLRKYSADGRVMDAPIWGSQ